MPSNAETQLRLAAIVSSSDDSIISTDLAGTITSWNRSAERIFGYSESEALGQPIQLLIPPDLEWDEQAILSRIRAGESLDHLETIRLRKDGRLIDVSLAVSPLVAANGEVIGSSRIARDITDRKRLERQAAHLAAIVESTDD